MSKYPSEIFGYPTFVRDEASETARSKHWCPFVDRVCYKQSRLIDFPFGVCTVHMQGQDIAVCPRRFLDNHQVFSDIANSHFGGTSDILLFSEVRLPNTGSFDFVMVKHKPISADIEDFVAIEFQTGQTTGTGGLVAGMRDFMNGADVTYRSYGFGLNAYDIWKRTFTQVLNKGVIMENWGKKVYWVVQEPVYRGFEKRYNLQSYGNHPDHSTIFVIYDLVPTKASLALIQSRTVTATVDQLFAAFRNNPNIPPLDEFVQNLRTRVDTGAQLSLHLDGLDRPATIDVRPPSATGRFREHADQYGGDQEDLDLFL